MHILFFLEALLSEIAGTVAGFGSSTIFLPLALQFFDFRTGLVLVAFFHLFGNIGRISFFRHGLNKKLLVTFGLPSVALSTLGALLVSIVPQETLKGILGIFLIMYALLFFHKDTFQVKSTTFNTVFGGGISGFLAGLIGTGGALRGAFLTAFGLPKEQYIATASAIALAVDMTRIPLYVAQGFLSNKYYWYLPLLFILALLGSFIGKQIVKKIPQKQFRKLVLLAILIIGVLFVFDWLQ